MLRSTISKSAARFIDQCFWGLFLLLLIVVSTLSQRFDTALWQLTAGFFFTIFGLYLFALSALELPLNRKGLSSAKWLLGLMFLLPIWLCLQNILPNFEHNLFTAVVDRDAPSWWQPKLKISVTPEKTPWLALSSFFLACWTLLALGLLHSRSRVRQLLWVVFVITVFHALAGLVALQKGFYFIDKDLVDGHFDVARGWFVNRNHFAASLVLGAAAGLAISMQLLSKLTSSQETPPSTIFRIIVLWLGITGIAIALLSSESRAGVLAPVLMLVIFVGSFVTSKLGYKRGILVATLFIVCCALLILSTNNQLASRISAESFSLGERWAQWAVTLEAIFQAPFFGYGGGSYGAVFQLFRDHHEFRQVVYNQAHNQFLHIWLEQGLIGLLIWLMILVLVFKRVCSTIKGSLSVLARSVSWACFIVLGAAVLQSLVDFNLQIVSLALAFHTGAALTFAAPYLNLRKVRHYKLRRVS